MRSHFEKFLGLGNASDNENDLLAYGYDASETQGKARLVLFPSQEEQLRLIMTFCNRSNLDVVLRGNGSNIVGASVPQNSIVVSMQGFDRIHSLNVGEQWVKVDAGVTIHELNESLKEHGFCYPLETGSSKLNTVGGWIAMNGLARQSQLYGRAADTVLELEVMDGTGKAFTATKDLREYTGNEGSVFIIIRAKLKIVPLKERSVDIHYFDTIAEAVSAAQIAIDEKPLSIEFLDAATATYAGFNTKHTVLVEWNDGRGSVKYEDYAQAMYKREQVRKHLGVEGYVLIGDSTVEQRRLAEAIDWCISKGLPVAVHAGLGIVHPFFKREQENLMEEWNDWLLQRNCSPVGQFGYGTKRKKYVPGNLKNKIRKLKERYDYNNVLGKGKLYDYV